MNISVVTVLPDTVLIIMCLVAPELTHNKWPIMTDSLVLHRLTIFCCLHKTTSTGIKSLSSLYCVILDVIATQHIVFPTFSGDQSKILHPWATILSLTCPTASWVMRCSAMVITKLHPNCNEWIINNLINSLSHFSRMPNWVVKSDRWGNKWIDSETYCYLQP